MMELLAIKIGEQYVRVRGEEYELCTMDKATVVGLSERRYLMGLLSSLGIKEKGAVVVKLTITEEIFSGDPDEA